MALILLIGSALMGSAIVRRALGQTLRLAEQLLWGIVVGWLLSSALIYIVARSFGRLTFANLITTAIVASVIALILLLPDLKSFRQLQFTNRWGREHTGLAIVLVPLTLIIWKVFSAQMFASDAGGVYSSGSSVYDLSFHAAVASSFAYGGNFPPIYTPLPPEPLLYPPLADFHAAVLMRAGWSIRSAFVFTALPLATVLVGLFYFFALRLSRSARAAVIATILFFFNGGLGFIYFFRDWRASGRGLIEMLMYPAANYCNHPSLRLHWVNVITDGLAPQRTTLYALPVALMVLTLFVFVCSVEESTQTEERNYWKLNVVSGLLAGSLCYVQPHIAIAIGVIALGLLLLRPRRAWLFFFVPAAALSAPFLITTLGHATTGGFMRFQPGWLGRDEPHQIVYWLRNLGLPLLLIIPSYFTARRLFRKFYLPFVAVMLLAVLFVLSPNDYDNLKLMIVWYAATAVLIGSWLARLTLKRWAPAAVAVFVLVCIASGLLAARRGMIERELIFTNDQLTAAEFVRKHTSARSLFLTAPTFHQPVLSLAGRSIVRGPTSWLWSHGYNFQEREADVRRIYAGAADAPALIRYYKIDYVYVGEAERADLKADASYFDTRYAAIYRTAAITIYDTRGDESSGGAREKPAPRELASRIDVDPYSLLTDFPRTSFYAYRIIKASTSGLPRRDALANMMKQLGRSVYLGRPGSETQLSLNQKTLVEDWVQGGEFRQRFDGKSNSEFVDTISRNTGQTLSKESRDGLVGRLNNGETRAAVLKEFIEGKEFYAREYNTAYVLMHFFGYLGRNPGDAPDTDLSGFEFWRSNLDKTGDYRALSRAFLESGEYKSRPIR